MALMKTWRVYQENDIAGFVVSFSFDKCHALDEDGLTVKNNYDHLSGEWWDANPIDVLRQATQTGAAPNISDAYTINGQPGDLYKCSSQGQIYYYYYWLIFIQLINIAYLSNIVFT